MKFSLYSFFSFLILTLTFLTFLILIDFFFLGQKAWAVSEEKISENFPFLVIKSKMAKVRFGPGAYYPVKFIFLKINIPVMILSNLDEWYQIKDIEGQIGWVHQSLVNKKNYALTKKFTFGYQEANSSSKKRVKIDKNILAYIKKCHKDWCYIWVEGHKCWVKQANLWGVSSSTPIKAYP